MTLRCFVDAPILIALQDRSQARKRALARHSLRSVRRNGELVVSPHVMSEFYALAIRRFPFVSRDVIRDFIGDLMPACRSASASELMERAFRIEDRFKFEWRACLTAASAVAADCRYLLSESLEDGLSIDRTIVINPFATDIETVFTTLKDR
jgi:predicted nucleic acid-binding protein